MIDKEREMENMMARFEAEREQRRKQFGRLDGDDDTVYSEAQVRLTILMYGWTKSELPVNKVTDLILKFLQEEDMRPEEVLEALAIMSNADPDWYGVACVTAIALELDPNKIFPGDDDDTDPVISPAVS